MRFNDRIFSIASRLILVSLVILVGCATSPAVKPDEILPMYGQPEMMRSDEQKRTDEEFISRVAASFSGSRERASIALWRDGEEFIHRGNLDFAMQRYNQSWLLNPNNYQPYWGFGMVSLERDKIDLSIKNFETAIKLCNDDYQKPAVLSDTGAAYAYKAKDIVEGSAERTRFFALANEHFVESTKLDQSYPNSWKQWARSLYFEGMYGEAWKKVKKGRELGVVLPPSFIKSLTEKMPEPQ